MVQKKDTIIGIRLYPSDEGLSAPDFLDAANNFIRLISEVDIMVSGQFVRTVDWKIARLSYSSPAVLEVEPFIKENKPDNRQAVIETVIDGFNSLERTDTRPRYFTDQALTSARNLAAQLIDRVNDVEVYSTYGNVKLSDKVTTNIKTMLKTGKDIMGSLDGYLELMNSHEGFQFAIYEPVMGSRIVCHVASDAPVDLHENIISYYEKKVRISGVLHTNIKGEVRSAKVNDIEPLRMESKIRSIEDIAGIFDITGGVDAEDYIRGLRDA